MEKNNNSLIQATYDTYAIFTINNVNYFLERVWAFKEIDNKLYPICGNFCDGYEEALSYKIIYVGNKFDCIKKFKLIVENVK